MKLYDVIRSEFLNQFNVIRAKNEVFVTELVTCPIRRSFYDLYGDDSALIHGIAVHQAVQSTLSRYSCQAEVPVSLSVPERGVLVRGRADLVCPDNHVVEIKTSSKVNPEHVVQLFLYKFAMNTSNASLVYVSPSTFSVFDLVDNMLCNEADGKCVNFPVKLDYHLILSLVDHYLNGEKTPQFSQCSSCFFRSQCSFRSPS